MYLVEETTHVAETHAENQPHHKLELQLYRRFCSVLLVRAPCSMSTMTKNHAPITAGLIDGKAGWENMATGGIQRYDHALAPGPVKRKPRHTTSGTKNRTRRLSKSPIPQLEKLFLTLIAPSSNALSVRPRSERSMPAWWQPTPAWNRSRSSLLRDFSTWGTIGLVGGLLGCWVVVLAVYNFPAGDGGSAEPTRDKKNHRHVPQEGVQPGLGWVVQLVVEPETIMGRRRR